MNSLQLPRVPVKKKPGDFPYSDPGRLVTYTVPLFAKEMGVDPSTVRRWIYKGLLLAEKQGGTWIIKIDPWYVPEYLKV